MTASSKLSYLLTPPVVPPLPKSSPYCPIYHILVKTAKLASASQFLSPPSLISFAPSASIISSPLTYTRSKLKLLFTALLIISRHVRSSSNKFEHTSRLIPPITLSLRPTPVASNPPPSVPNNSISPSFFYPNYAITNIPAKSPAPTNWPASRTKTVSSSTI